MTKEELLKNIKLLRKEKNAIILAHYYQESDIQDIADFVGDSLALAQWASKTTADIIVLCGVHFMGETAKILSPEKGYLYRISWPVVLWQKAARQMNFLNLCRHILITRSYLM